MSLFQCVGQEAVQFFKKNQDMMEKVVACQLIHISQTIPNFVIYHFKI